MWKEGLKDKHVTALVHRRAERVEKEDPEA